MGASHHIGVIVASKRKPRPPLTEAEFFTLFEAVHEDITSLQLHDEIFTGVAEQLNRYPRVFHNFSLSFGTFLTAMRTDMVIRLGRIYDPEGTGRASCTLERCLCVLRDSPSFFTDAAITARLREDYKKWNPGYLQRHRLDPDAIAKDLEQITTSRERLITLRHKLYAHKDLDTILSGKRDGFLDSHDEVRALIKLAHDIWNRYSLIWNCSEDSGKLPGRKESYWLFNCLRRGLKVKTFADRFQFERIHKRRKRIACHRAAGSDTQSAE
ncbi:MAG: hypothetical protein WCH84_08265 [Verrucomicrobiota bacterium]